MPALSVEELKAMARRFVDELQNKGNKAVVYEFMAPEFVYHTAQPPITRDREGIIQEAALLRAAFPDLRYTVDDLLVEGDKGVMHWTIRGTHKGDFFGIAPTQKQIAFSGLILARMKDGKFAEAWSYPDNMSLFQQLGAFPQFAATQPPITAQPQVHA